MGKIIIPKAVERKKGYLYYFNKEGDLCEAKMKNGSTKNKNSENKK